MTVINPSPAPVFPSCKAIQELEKAGAPDALLDWTVRAVNVMLKLQALQPEGEREKFVSCRAAGVEPAATGKPKQ